MIIDRFSNDKHHEASYPQDRLLPAHIVLDFRKGIHDH